MRNMLVVGEVQINEPDFEFHYFSITQLVSAISRYEHMQNLTDLVPLNEGDFAHCRNAKQLARRYEDLRSAPSFKGTTWGAALAQEAFSENGPIDENSNSFVHFINSAIRSITTDYEAQRIRGPVDAETLQTRPTSDPVF
ncbi:MAG: hypothetical protein JST40_11360 [Armatimonadetes bacterium]|nr:hypothetical protein [Armatimonadota bacterium]